MAIPILQVLAEGGGLDDPNTRGRIVAAWQHWAYAPVSEPVHGWPGLDAGKLCDLAKRGATHHTHG